MECAVDTALVGHHNRLEVVFLPFGVPVDTLYLLNFGGNGNRKEKRLYCFVESCPIELRGRNISSQSIALLYEAFVSDIGEHGRKHICRGIRRKLFAGSGYVKVKGYFCVVVHRMA